MTRGARKALRRAPVFHGMEHDELDQAAELFRLRRYPAHDFLFMEGDPARQYYLLVKGRVKVLQTSDEGEEVILHMLSPGDLAGALPTLGGGEYPASAQAMREVEALTIAAQDFDQLMARFPIISGNMLRIATHMLQSAHRRLRELATERVERRLARTLGRLAASIGRQTEEGVLIDAPLSRQDLAQMAGTTLFSASRILKGWERKGLLIAGRERVVILDPHGLTVIAEDLPDRG